MELELNKNDFILSVIKFLISNPMLDIAHISPIIDYIWFQKYTRTRAFDENGVAYSQLPLQQNFSMNGRTVESLLVQVERWHRQLGKERKVEDAKQWEHSIVKNFEFHEGEGPTKRTWRIYELVKREELIAEGRAMRHCVASYASSCANGQSSIWSLTKQDSQGLFRHITIEVRKNIICQMRGWSNRVPNIQEMLVIRRWCQQESLKIAGYLVN